MDATIVQIEELMQRGALGEAESLCREVLQRAPGEARAWYNLGLVTLVQGAYEEAEAALRQALGLAPDNPEWWNNLSVANFQQGKMDEAASCAKLALSHGNSTAAPWINLGNIAVRQARWADAAPAYRRALEIDPRQAAAWCNLAVAERELGHPDEALTAFDRSLQLAPSDITTLTQYGWLLTQRGQPLRAIEALSPALLPVAPAASAWVVAGHALKELGKTAQAVETYRRALDLDPEQFDARYGLAVALVRQWKLSEAESLIRECLSRNPKFAHGWVVLGGIQQFHGDPEQACQSFRRAVEIDPRPQHHGTLLVGLQYEAEATPEGLLAAHRQWDATHARALLPGSLPLARPAARRPLRIGLISSGFGRHPIAFLALAGLESLDHSQCEVVCYSDRLVEDDCTARFRAAATSWRVTAGVFATELAELVRHDEIDVLFDLTGHTDDRLLVFARKPAALQVTWLGYVGTTGLAAMDCLLADRFHVRPGEEGGYSENVLRMPGSYACFGPPLDSPDVAPLPALTTGRVTFGSFNNPSKFSSLTMDVWSEVLRRVPGSQLLLKFGGLDDPAVQARLRSKFAEREISAERIVFEGWAEPNELLSTYHRVDLSLDTLPYSGGLTTCESLWMGVPVVAWPGATFASRHATSHLTHAGYGEFVAADRPGYIRLATHWANQLDALAQIRSAMRQRVSQSPLCDAQQFGRDFLHVVRQAWETKVASLGQREA